MELASVREANIKRRHLLARLYEVMPELRERGVERVIVYGSILDEKRFQPISDIDLALSGKEFSFKEQLRIISLLEDAFGEDDFHAVFLTGEGLLPREVIRKAILKEGMDAERFICSAQGSNSG